MALTNPTVLTGVQTPVMPAQGVASPALTATFLATDAVNGNSFTATGQDLVILNNTDTNPQTVTFYSAPDASGRYADVVDYPIAAGAFIDVRFVVASLFTQPLGSIQFKTSSALVKALILNL